jgi:hypothetical protein
MDRYDDQDDVNQEESGENNKRLSKKEWAKKMRREAYERAKEFKKNDPREIARKAAAKEQRKALYQKAKERHKKALKDDGLPEQPDLSAKVMLARDLDERPLAPVIPIDFGKLKQKRQQKS